MADMINILNTIRDNASQAYKDRVPEATRDNIAAVGNPIIEYDVIGNEFLGELINRIAMTMVTSKVAKNPLAILKKGSVPLGQDIQDIFVNMSKGETFDPNSTDLLKVYKPDVKSAYYRLNRRNKYPVTISEEMLSTAFTSYNNLEKLLTGIVNTLYSEDNNDEFLLMKQLVISAVYDGLVKCEKVVAPNDKESCEDFLVTMRSLSGKFKFPSSKFNRYKVYAEEKGLTNPTDVVTWTPLESQVLLITTDVLSQVGVKALAAAFHMDEAKFLGRVVEVDQFDDDGKIQAIICDEAFFQVWDNLTRLKVFENGDNLTRKYILHRWETLAVSPFANAVCLLTDYIPPSAINAEDLSVKAGETAQIVLTYTPDNGVVDKTVLFESSDTTKATVSDTGVVTGVAAGTATITITSAATYPEGVDPVEKEITVTVTSA